MGKELLTIPQAAGRMTVSVKTAWRMMYAGKFEVVRIGRSVRVTGKSVDDVIEEGTTPPAASEVDVDHADDDVDEEE